MVCWSSEELGREGGLDFGGWIWLWWLALMACFGSVEAVFGWRWFVAHRESPVCSPGTGTSIAGEVKREMRFIPLIVAHLFNNDWYTRGSRGSPRLVLLLAGLVLPSPFLRLSGVRGSVGPRPPFSVTSLPPPSVFAEEVDILATLLAAGGLVAGTSRPVGTSAGRGR